MNNGLVKGKGAKLWLAGRRASKPENRLSTGLEGRPPCVSAAGSLGEQEGESRGREHLASRAKWATVHPLAFAVSDVK